MTNTILFDLDGTLTDSQEGITKCLQYAMEKLGRKVPTVEETLPCIGPPLHVSFPEILGVTEPDEIDRAIEFYRERFKDVGKFENLLYPDIHETLQELKDNGFKLFVATSKAEVYAKDITDHFDVTKYFNFVYGSMLDGTFTDKGELIHRIMKEENLSLESTILVGDRKHDIIGAQKAGIDSIGVLYGFGSKEELNQIGATRIASSPLEILTIAKELLAS